MTGKTMRDNPLFMRNSFATTGKWGIPLVKKQELTTENIMLVACSDTRANDNEANKKKGVHFLLMIIVFREYMTIPSAHWNVTLNMRSCSHQTFRHIATWICGDSLKVLQKIDGLVRIGKAKVGLLFRQSVGAHLGVSNSALTE